MALDTSIAQLFGNLKRFSKFPKYSVERRVDLFVALYLEEFLTTKLGSEVVLVAPEFPLKASNNQSTNVDYLLRRSGTPASWLFLELKTNMDSLSRKQLAIYAAAQKAGMPGLVADLELIRKASGHKDKYAHLIAQMKAFSHDAPIELVMLSPGACPDELSKSLTWFRLREMAAWEPQNHVELWQEVKALLLELDPA